MGCWSVPWDAAPVGEGNALELGENNPQSEASSGQNLNRVSIGKTAVMGAVRESGRIVTIRIRGNPHLELVSNFIPSAPWG